MKQDQVCSKCGAKLSSDAAPEGLCPQCLFKLGLESQGKEPDTAPWIEALRSPKEEFQTPGAIGPYRILEMLGEGGMGIVYLCYDHDEGKSAALKTFQLPTLAGEPAAWAFAAWGGDFWVFLMKGTELSTTVYQVDGASGQIKGMTYATNRTIVGAGVSTCAPTVIL